MAWWRPIDRSHHRALHAPGGPLADRERERLPRVVVECGAEDFRYGVAINRIRNYYKQIAGDQAKLFLLSGYDDGRGVFENAAVPFERRKQFFSFATVVAVVNSVVGGSAIAIALGVIADASLGVAAGVGGVAAIASLGALLRYADRLLEERAGRTESIFPSPK